MHSIWQLPIRAASPRRPGAAFERTGQLADTEQTILLDRKTRLVRSGARIAIQKLKSNGEWDLEASFQGGARAIQRWCEENNVYPTREAEAELSRVPEKGFVDRV